MGYKSRDAILEFKRRITPIPSFRFDNTIIRKGQVIGTWKRIVNKNSMEIMYDLFKPLNTEQLIAFNRAIRRLQDFTGLQVIVKNTEPPA